MPPSRGPGGRLKGPIDYRKEVRHALGIKVEQADLNAVEEIRVIDQAQLQACHF